MEKEQTKSYKSIEERIFVDTHIDKIAKDILEYGIKSFYGTVASIFRIPTAIRKFDNFQTFIKREENIIDNSIPKSTGIVLGGLAGAVACTNYLILSGQQAYFQESYILSTILCATNLLSMGYELGRLKKAKEKT